MSSYKDTIKNIKELFESRKKCRKIIIHGDTPEIKSEAKFLFDGFTKHINLQENDYKHMIKTYETLHVSLLSGIHIAKQLGLPNEKYLTEKLQEINKDLKEAKEVVSAITAFKKAEAPPIPPRPMTFKNDSLRDIKQNKEQNFKPPIPARKPPAKPST